MFGWMENDKVLKAILIIDSILMEESKMANSLFEILDESLFKNGTNSTEVRVLTN